MIKFVSLLSMAALCCGIPVARAQQSAPPFHKDAASPASPVALPHVAVTDGRRILLPKGTQGVNGALLEDTFNRSLPKDLSTYTFAQIQAAGQTAYEAASPKIKGKITITITCCPLTITLGLGPAMQAVSGNFEAATLPAAQLSAGK